MEELKKLEELTNVDQIHNCWAKITGWSINLELLHQKISSINLHEGVPVNIRGQFNVARNMALYVYFFYALAPEVQLKTYTLIELALRLRLDTEKPLMLGGLLKKAVNDGLIKDVGFRHIENPQSENPYSRSLIKLLPSLRNESAHGSDHLTQDFVCHLEICADLINQLFPDTDEA